MVAVRGDGGVGVKRGLGGEGKPLGLPLIRNQSFSFFPRFFFDFPFVEFCSLRHFEVSNSALTKNLKISSSFFYNFLFQKFSIFLKNSNSSASLLKTGETGPNWFLRFS
jgi:hypothetical protein